MDSKKCTSCGQIKPISDFWRHSSASDGLQSNCKDCRRSARLRTVDRAQKRQRAREYYADHRERICARQRHYYALTRDAIKARNATRYGAVERQPCEVCGAFPADAHHDDYTQPLKVRWLCRRHHREHHARERLVREGLLPPAKGRQSQVQQAVQ